MVAKLRVLRSKLKSWNGNVFGELNSKSAAIQVKIDDLELVAEQRSLSFAESDALRHLQANLLQSKKCVDNLWFQKSRVNWALQGDKNTHFSRVWQLVISEIIIVLISN